MENGGNHSLIKIRPPGPQGHLMDMYKSIPGGEGGYSIYVCRGLGVGANLHNPFSPYHACDGYVPIGRDIFVHLYF